MNAVLGIGSSGHFSVVATLGADELPNDLAEYARKKSQRNVRRLLDRAFYAPYAAAVELNERHDVGDLERCALFTVSSWDPSIPIPDYAFENSQDLLPRLSHFYMHPANPSDWLRRMPNNPICNIAITTGFRGPSMHYIGGAHALSMITTVALSALADGSADAAMVVAYDMPEGMRHLLAHEVDSAAAAVLISAWTGGVPADLLVTSASTTQADTSALTAMQEFIVSTRVGASR